MAEQERLFEQGRANPQEFGWPIRSSAGARPDPVLIESVARNLDRPVFHVDAEGYECEIIGAAVDPSGRIAYVETRAKDVGTNPFGANQRHIDISIQVKLVDLKGQTQSADIVSYNPFFGCDVRFFEWIEETAVLIYCEKHSTYACCFGEVWPPRFVEIENKWIINNNSLGFIGYKEAKVRRLSLPQLKPLPAVTTAEAKRIGLHPTN